MSPNLPYRTLSKTQLGLATCNSISDPTKRFLLSFSRSLAFFLFPPFLSCFLLFFFFQIFTDSVSSRWSLGRNDFQTQTEGERGKEKASRENASKRGRPLLSADLVRVVALILPTRIPRIDSPVPLRHTSFQDRTDRMTIIYPFHERLLKRPQIHPYASLFVLKL